MLPRVTTPSTPADADATPMSKPTPTKSEMPALAYGVTVLPVMSAICSRAWLSRSAPGLKVKLRSPGAVALDRLHLEQTRDRPDEEGRAEEGLLLLVADEVDRQIVVDRQLLDGQGGPRCSPPPTPLVRIELDEAG